MKLKIKLKRSNDNIAFYYDKKENNRLILKHYTT